MTIGYTPLEDLKLNNKSDKDTDGDGIPDYLELSEYDLGTFDNTTGDYKPANYGHYFNLASNIGILVSGSVGDKIMNTYTSSFRSHPFNRNSDDDDYTDDEDGTPEEENEDLIEILSLVDNTCMWESGWFKEYYESKGKKCRIRYFNGYDTFILQWNRIGGSDDGSYDYYYNVTDVILISHGNPGYFLLGNNVALTSKNTRDGVNFHRIEDIDDCRQFDNLEMMICSSDCVPDEDGYTKSTAEAFFDHFRSINRVFAFDCTSCLVSGYDYPVWAGAVMYFPVIPYVPPLEPSLNDPQMLICLSTSSCKGQVLYERGKDKNSDLYDGLDDVQIEVYYTKMYTTGYGAELGEIHMDPACVCRFVRAICTDFESHFHGVKSHL
ncbi:hypothetical protein [Ruminococcus albus]|uniref:Uncharacterized protein n=1 Tax=Ruminococcus albus (strain ATCC 27210 / DSM 20455 / JCM 14654 / NCDO 2250 / 7) TaxID=697329 RepID=E6UFL7_RUMA7|nr:hypothetical protein [Ruminococcus albus]ADU21921.1 hypothetical protein Rumal_1407 [Ruminococcus albus 7 = DSM 20455]